MSPIQTPSCKAEQARVGVLQALLHLGEEIQVGGKADQRESGKMEEVSEPTLMRPKGGYRDECCLILLHLVEDLWEQRNGWEGIADFNSPWQEKSIAL